MGEILGLTWDNVPISDGDIAADDAWIYVGREVARATRGDTGHAEVNMITRVYAHILDED